MELSFLLTMPGQPSDVALLLGVTILHLILMLPRSIIALVQYFLLAQFDSLP